MSWIDLSVSRSLTRAVLRNAKSSTASSRSWMRSSATSGRSSHARSSRPPIGVIVRSISCSSDPVAAAVRRLDHLEVAAASSDRRSGSRRRCGTRCRGRARDPPSACRAGTARSAPAAETAAGRSSRPKPCERLRLQLLEQRAARRFVLERPRLGAWSAARRCATPLEQRAPRPRSRPARGSRAAAGPRARRRSAARPSAPAYSAVVNSPVDRSSSATPKPGPGCIGASASRNAGSRASR